MSCQVGLEVLVSERLHDIDPLNIHDLVLACPLLWLVIGRAPVVFVNEGRANEVDVFRQLIYVNVGGLRNRCLACLDCLC
jgi:hypothetical protein